MRIPLTFLLNIVTATGKGNAKAFLYPGVGLLLEYNGEARLYDEMIETELGMFFEMLNF